MNSKDINERYHLKSKIQKRPINNKNFTYRILTSVLDRYIYDDETIVDIGCGVGTVDFYLASRDKFVTGIDESKVAIKTARLNSVNLNLSKNTEFIQKNIFNFQSDYKFDSALLFEVIEHLSQDFKAFKLANSLLKSKGLLFVSTRSLNSPLVKLGLAKKHDKYVGHLRRYDLEGLKNVITNYGFEVIFEKKTEGLLKEFLFSYPKFCSIIVRVANRFSFISDVLAFIDDMFLKAFGECQIIIVAKKK